MTRAGNIIVKLLGVILIVAAILKWHQLYTTPVANNSIWTYRPFLVAQFTGELAFGLWLVSQFFRKPAWLMALLCFIFFSLVTIYKGVTGADSCGCFGNVHVNPWITIFAVDLPAVIALALTRPKKPSQWLTPWPSWPRLATYAVICLIVLIPSTVILALHEPPAVTEQYEVLAPAEWPGHEFELLDRIHTTGHEDIASGDWILFFYRHDCPDCHEAMPSYKDSARELQGSGLFRTAFIAVPPVHSDTIEADPAWVLGQLDDQKDWLVGTPVVVLLSDGVVEFASEGEAPGTEELLETYLSLFEEE